MKSTDLPGCRLWIGIPGPDLDGPTRALLEEIRPGGVLLFGRNVRDADQVKALVCGVRELLGTDTHLVVDHEGGIVTRFPQELVVYPGNMALGAAGMREPALGEHLAEEQGFRSARELRALGIDVNLAPVLDLVARSDGPGVGVRGFGVQPELVERLGAALVGGTLRGGVIPCIKHFPGLGRAAIDPHIGLPVVSGDGDEEALRPFRHAVSRGAPLLMTSHQINERLDPDSPVTLSRKLVTDLVRGDLGHLGAVMTDDLEMGAMTTRYGFDEVVRGAAAAGHDILAICHRADRQRLAFDLLRKGIEEGLEWFGDADGIASRLDALRAPASVGTPDPEAGRRLAEAIAGRAVTVIRDDRGLLPLADDASVLVASPVLEASSGVEDPLRGEDPSGLAAALGARAEFHGLPLSPGSDDITALLERARLRDRLIVLTSSARFDGGQAELLARCALEHPGSILVPLRQPSDCEVLPAGTAFTAVTAYGFRSVHFGALARVLAGAVQPYGRLPVELELD